MLSSLAFRRCRKVSCLSAPGYLLVLVCAAYLNGKTMSCVRAEGRNTMLEWEHCHSQPLDGLHFMFVTCNSYL